MTAPTAAVASKGQRGLPSAPRRMPTAAGSHHGAQPQPRIAVLKAARSRRSARGGGRGDLGS
eukprot:9001734-Alexandrium_andersonii.AAC.1